MEISVTDGISVTTVEVRVEVSLSGDRGPRLATGASLSLTVASKSTAVITRSHLAYVVSAHTCPLVSHCTLQPGWLESDAVSENWGFRMWPQKEFSPRLPSSSTLRNGHALYSNCSRCLTNRQVNEQTFLKTQRACVGLGDVQEETVPGTEKPRHPYFKFHP